MFAILWAQITTFDWFAIGICLFLFVLTVVVLFVAFNQCKGLD